MPSVPGGPGPAAGVGGAGGGGGRGGGGGGAPGPAAQPDLIVRARRVVTPDGIRPADVHVRGGVIIAVTDPGDQEGRRAAAAANGQDELGDAGQSSDPGGRPGAAAGSPPVIELAGDEVLLPGLVDSHVHVNEPGRTDWEGFLTATLAAAAGGVTTIIDMPLNSLPPVTDVAALAAKQRAAAGQCHVDVGFWGGAVPGNDEARAGLHAAGVFGFKCFTVDSGVPEFPPLDDAGLAAASRQCAALDALLIVHAEDADLIAAAPPASGPAYAAYLRSRPAAAETAAVARVIGHARAAGARAHVLHLSAAAAVPLLDAARAEGLAVSAETCPHYLALAAEDVTDGATLCKCCPPVRDAANRERLWQALADGVIGCVVSDHSPCPPALKGISGGEAGPFAGGDFGTAWGGISSLQLSLPVMWTAARERGHDLTAIARWMADGPARLAGLRGKGVIAPGRDADLVAFAPDERFTVRPDALLTRHRLTPYAGRELSGVVRRTWLRGAAVTAASPAGRLLAREGRPP